MGKIKMTLKEYCEENSEFKNLLDEWDYELNAGLTPDDVGYGSMKKVHWKLPYDVPLNANEYIAGKHFDFTWESAISDRSRKDIRRAGCPYLSGHKLWQGFNDLATLNPFIAAQWDYIKNFPLTPSDVMECSNTKYWWIYPYDDPITGKHFNFSWDEKPGNRKYWPECPYLSNPPKRLWPGFNDLATKNPKLVKEWHPNKNKNLKPCDIFPSANKKIWWLLPYDVPMDYPIEHLRGKHFDFEWETTANNRDRGKGCPYLDTCTSPLLWRGFNDLGARFPQIAKQWHPTKNGNLKPCDVLWGSNKKVWWICEHEHEWEAVICARTSFNTGCPICFESKGEKSIRTVLDSQNINYKTQYVIKERGKFRDDFGILDKNGKLIATIEYHGEQHYFPVDFAGKGDKWAQKEFEKNQKRDKIKSDYLKAHKIPQLIIPYWEFYNIKGLVLEFLKSINNKDASA